MNFNLDVYYDRSGIPISYEEFGRLFMIPGYRVVEQTVLADAADPTTGYDVSTVWLGIDHGWGSHELPVIFETMVFRLGGAEVDSVFGEGANNSDLACSRYSLETEAQEGHALYVVEYSLKLTDPVIMDRTPLTEPEGS